MAERNYPEDRVRYVSSLHTAQAVTGHPQKLKAPVMGSCPVLCVVLEYGEVIEHDRQVFCWA